MVPLFCQKIKKEPLPQPHTVRISTFLTVGLRQLVRYFFISTF
ncbi:hypothetical protein D932_02853 [Enterococcus casseliflavus 14-MB-W-14]|nr:hypothetical protein D932_02853 [Enterococcus casseliflavus 14-MB-W-14]